MSDAVKVGFVAFSAAPRGVLVVFCDDALKFGEATRKALGAAANTVKRAAAANQFKGKSGSTLDIPAPDGIKAERLIVVGVGKAADIKEKDFLKFGGVTAGKLKAGDEALVWDIWHQEGRSKSSLGVYDALTKAGLKVEKLDVTQDVDSDPTKGIPIMTAYLAAHPNLKAIGTQHGQITAILPKILKDAGKKPGDVVVGGIDLGPDVIAGIKSGYVVASFDQVLYLQGWDPVQQIWLTKNYLIPGLHQDTGVGEVTPSNVDTIAPLIEKGFR